MSAEVNVQRGTLGLPSRLVVLFLVKGTFLVLLCQSLSNYDMQVKVKLFIIVYEGRDCLSHFPVSLQPRKVPGTQSVFDECYGHMLIPDLLWPQSILEVQAGLSCVDQNLQRRRLGFPAQEHLTTSKNKQSTKMFLNFKARYPKECPE